MRNFHSSFRMIVLMLSVAAVVGVVTLKSLSHADAQAQTIVGYMGIYSGSVTGCESPGGLVSTAKETPIYKNYNVQTFSPNNVTCINYIRLMTSDPVQLVNCPGTNPGPIFTGPGTFLPTVNDFYQCESTDHQGSVYSVTEYPSVFFTNSVQLVSPPLPVINTISDITHPSASTSDPYVHAGDTITITGTNFQAPSGSTLLQIINYHDNNNADWQTLYTLPRSANSSYTFNLPSNLTAGDYAIKVTNSVGYHWVELTVQNTAGPTNLTAAITSEGQNDLGTGVTLNWLWSGVPSDNTSFQIEEATDSAAQNFSTVATTLTSTYPSGSSYSYVINPISFDSPQETYRVKTLYPNNISSDYSNTAKVTNCVSLGGTGTDNIVFLRGNTFQGSASDFMQDANYIINTGFKAVDPFKTYIDHFSFLADLQVFDQHLLTSVNDPIFFDSAQPILDRSSCGPSDMEYIFLFDDGTHYAAWTSSALHKVVFLNVHKNPVDGLDNLAITAIHESGHSMGRLNDEYLTMFNSETATTTTYGGVDTNFSNLPPASPNYSRLIGDMSDYELDQENCTLDPVSSYTALDANGNIVWYGANKLYQGCTYSMSSTANYKLYYRPSNDSIMADNSKSDKFNVISCGYLISAILGETVDQWHAAKHWPECMKLDTVKDGISNTKIISVSGVGTGMKNGLFTYMGDEFPANDAVHIASGWRSIAKNSMLLVNAINDQLDAGNNVLVVGHSMGAFVAYNIHDLYANDPKVKFLYVDPPYKFFACKISGVFKAICNDMQDDPQANIVNWTNGSAFGLFFSNFYKHDPFDIHTPTGQVELTNLATTIRQAMTNTCSVSCPTVPDPSLPALSASPTITSVLSSSGSSIKPGDTVTITGSGFNTAGNDILIQNTSIPEAVYYYVHDIVPNSSTQLSFIMPSSPDLSVETVSGTYTVEVSGENSDWSNQLNVNVADPVETLTPPQVNALEQADTSFGTGSPNDLMLDGSGFSSVGNSIELTPSPINMLQSINSMQAFSFGAILQSLKSFFVPQEASAQSVTYTINDIWSNGSSLVFSVPTTTPNGIYTVSVKGINGDYVLTPFTITVANGVVTGATGINPTISLSNTPAITVPGQGTTVFWSSTRATSCIGSGTGDSGVLAAWDKSQPLTGTLFIKPAQNTTLNLVCSGQFGISTSTITITTPPPYSNVSYDGPSQNTWIVPAGVTSITAEVWGGGGGGGSNLAGGGGGGGYAKKILTVIPGTSYMLVAGGGGAGGLYISASSTHCTNSAGKPGQNSALFLGNSTSSIVYATGGGGGKSSSCVSVAMSGGIGGSSSSTNLVNMVVGGNGENYVSHDPNVYGSSPVITAGGNGGNGGNGSMEFPASPGCSYFGETPVVPGGGGYGEHYASNNCSKGGGTGAAGRIAITINPSTALPAPVISSINPTSGPFGTVIQVKGLNLSNVIGVITTNGSSTSVFPVAPNSYLPIGNGVDSSYEIFSFVFSTTTMVSYGNDSIAALNSQGSTSNSLNFSVDAPSSGPTQTQPTGALPAISLSAAPMSVLLGKGSTVAWASNGADSCVIAMPATTTPLLPVALSGSMRAGPFNSLGNQTVSLYCHNSLGTTTQSIILNVVATVRPSKPTSSGPVPAKTSSGVYFSSPSESPTPSSSDSPSPSPVITTPSSSPSDLPPPQPSSSSIQTTMDSDRGIDLLANVFDSVTQFLENVLGVGSR